MINPNKLIGKIDSVKESSYKVIVHFGEATKGIRDINYNEVGDKYFKFNDQQYIIEEITYNSDGSAQSKKISTYNEKGDKIEELEEFYSMQCRSFDKNYKELKEESYIRKYNNTYKNIIKYNEKGEKYELKRYEKHIGLVLKKIYRYDNFGNNTQIKDFNKEGLLIRKMVYEYDEGGNEIECNLFMDGIFYYKFLYIYDENGNKIKEKHYDENGNLEMVDTFDFDNKGHKISSICQDFTNYGLKKKKGNILSKSISKYDSKGNIIEIINFNFDKNISDKISFEYEFDHNGNWIKRIEFKNEIPIYIKELNIIYK